MTIVVIAAALLLASGQAPATAPAPNKSQAVDPDKKVCKTLKETGSRLGGKRECKTQVEWDRIATENQQKAQSNMGR